VEIVLREVRDKASELVDQRVARRLAPAVCYLDDERTIASDGASDPRNRVMTAAEPLNQVAQSPPVARSNGLDDVLVVDLNA
jgi:hypothetical protein